MKNQSFFLLTVCALLGAMTACSSDADTIQPVPFTDVVLDGGFWAPRMQTELNVTVPFSVMQSAPAVERFRRCAAWRRGEQTELPMTHRFISSDMYKVMEGVAYSLMLQHNDTLEQWMDEVTALIAASQQEDGYLYISHICGNPSVRWMGEKPYQQVMQSHELYNMGHLYEAAVAYYQATGKRQLLDVALLNARHLNRVFFEGDPNYNDGKPVLQAPGHEEIELALCKLYRATGDTLMLSLAQRFLNIRGVTYIPDGEGIDAPDYAQQHMPVAAQREALGHCVRALYLYTGMAQVDALSKEKQYTEALHALWHNIVAERMYIIGGVGADHDIETFGQPYHLPNDVAYNETCASVANVFFNQAMFLAEGDAKYWDVAEISLFNNALAGIALAGNRFFYVNPLATDGEALFNHGTAGRAEWFGCACCPPNISRLILQTPGYMYAHTNEDIYVTLYAGNHTTIPLGSTMVEVRQQTDYPLNGEVHLTVNPARSSRFALRLRIPTWAQGKDFLPEGLYRYAAASENGYSILLNGQPVEATMEKGFAVIRRTWKAGDEVVLRLDMSPRYVVADERLTDDNGRVAVVLGPLVYCAESPDNAMDLAHLQTAQLPIETWQSDDSLLHNLPLLQTEGWTDDSRSTIRLIPYYTWANRGNNTQMCVWMAEKQ